MVPNQNVPILNPAAGPMAAFLQDPVINLRRRMTAILAEIYDQINQNRNQNAMAGRLADWFFNFRNAILRNENIAAVVNEHVPLLQGLLQDPHFRENQVVQFILNNFVPRIQTIFGPQILPNAPVPPPAPAQVNDRNEQIRQIRARVLGNQDGRMQLDARIEQQVDLQLNAELQQGLDAILQQMQGIFQVNMGRLHNMAQEDRNRIQRANQAIDDLENIIANVEAAIPHLENRVATAHRALDNLEIAIQHAKQEVAQLQEAVQRRNERESNSFFTTVLCIAACMAIRIVLPQSNATPIPGGLMVGPPPFIW